MPNYKKMYSTLFNKITDVIEDLQQIQQETEEIYIKEDNHTIKLSITDHDKMK